MRATVDTAQRGQRLRDRSPGSRQRQIIVVSAPQQSPAIGLSARAARIVLLMASGVFLVQAWLIAGAIPVSHEELAVHAAPPPATVTVERGTAYTSNACAGPSPLVFVSGRPSLIFCALGLAWPVMVTEYIGAVQYWPLQLLRPIHGGDPVALRRTALIVGVLFLVVLFALVEQLADSLCAAVAVSVAAVLPPFVVLSSMLVLFETAPELLVACAALVMARRPEPEAPPTWRRAAAAGALAGLAVLGNIKVVMLIAPLLAWALFESRALRRTSIAAWLAAAAAAALTVSPMVIAALADPQHRFHNQVNTRIADAASRLDIRLLAAEFFYPIIMAADPRYFFDGDLWPVTLLIPAGGFAYSVVALIRAVLRRTHDRVAAACGAIVLFYIVFVWLAYGQSIHANYSPIAAAQAVSIGCAIVAVGRWVARHGGPARLTIAAAVALTVISVVPNLYRRGDPRDLEVPMNLAAERALGDYLQRNPDRPVAVTSYNLEGLPDALTGRPALRLYSSLIGCASASDSERCERDVLAAMITAEPLARYLVVLRGTPMDEPPAVRALATIQEAARGLGGQVREEARFETPQGVPVLALVVVERGTDRSTAESREVPPT